MTADPLLDVRDEVARALRDGRPVVALESTLIAHGLPWPDNRDTALAAEAAVRQEGAVPATIALWKGRPTIGLTPAEVEELAVAPDVAKASRRDLGGLVASGRTAATTVSATMLLAHRAGLRVFATGGIGGVHRGATLTWDVSADLTELTRTPVAVVCAGAKSILDLPLTLEYLETPGVPVIGYTTDHFPAFYATSSGLPVPLRLDDPGAVARALQAHWGLGLAGAVVANPLPPQFALAPEELDSALSQAEEEARSLRGPALTPFLLRRMAELTSGRTLRANKALVIANASLAARIACALT